MKYHMDTYSIISVANYLGFLEGTGRMEINEVDHSLRRQGVLKDAK